MPVSSVPTMQANSALPPPIESTRHKTAQQLCVPVRHLPLGQIPSATAEDIEKIRARELRFGSIAEQPSLSYMREKRTREDTSQQYTTEETDDLQKKREPRVDAALLKSPSKPALIRDRYTEARGEPRIIEIQCGRCKEPVMEYQKDGPGRLLRCYLDRIRTPQPTFTDTTVRSATDLKCRHCFQVLGKPFIYHRSLPYPETRPAYKIVNAVHIREKNAPNQ